MAVVHRVGVAIVALVLAACGAAETAAPALTPTPVSTSEPAVTLTPVPKPDPTATSEPEDSSASYTIADLAGDNGLTQLKETAALVGLRRVLADADAGPFTVFAPSDAAFAEASASIDGMDSVQIERTLRYHIVEGEFWAADLPAGTELTTMQGESVTMGRGMVNDIDIVSADNVADNGVVHVIGAVLVPPSVGQELGAVGPAGELFVWECVDAVGDVEVESPGDPQVQAEPAVDLVRSSVREQSNGDLVVSFEVAGAVPASASDVIWVVTAWLEGGSINTFDYSLIGDEASVQIGDWEGDTWVVPGQLIRATGTQIEILVPKQDIPEPVARGQVESWSAGTESNHMSADPWFSLSDDCAPGTVLSTAPATIAGTGATSTAPNQPVLVMPNLVCVDLQQAQDDLQALTGKFFIDSYDSSGQSRFQINDSNWTVTEQSPEPGAEIIDDVSIGAIKDDEVTNCQ